MRIASPWPWQKPERPWHEPGLASGAPLRACLNRSLILACVLWPLALAAQTTLESLSASAPKLPSTDPRVQRAEAIVTRLLAVSPHALVGPAWHKDLYVLDVRSGRGFGGARMLPDGILLIDRRLVELAERKIADGHGEVLLAFVLAHELMHLLDPSDLEGSNVDDPAAEAFREGMADVRAVQLMAFAGYDIDALLVGIEGFLDEWVQISNESLLGEHTHARHAGVRSAIQKIRENLITFRAGLRLYERGEFLDAEALLTSYARTFPAPEARHARGLAALQVALFVLRHRVPPDWPGAAFARGCWPMPVPERSPRAQPVGHLLPVGVSPMVERLPEFLRNAVDDFDAADKGNGGSAEVRIARALAVLLRDAQAERDSVLAKAAVALDEAEAMLVKRATQPAAQQATRSRLALARANIAFARGNPIEGHALRAQAARPEAPSDVTACLACAIDPTGTVTGCTPATPPSMGLATVPGSPARPPQVASLPGVALGQTIDQVFTALRVQNPAVTRRSIDISLTSILLVHLPRISLFPGESGAIDLAFISERLVMVQWMPENPPPCAEWPHARVVGQLGNARALLLDGEGIGQQCVGDRLVVSYLFPRGTAMGGQP